MVGTARRLVGAAVVALLAVAVMAGPASAGKNGPNNANAKLCQKNGWQTLASSTGAPFVSEKDCTSYAAGGGAFGLVVGLAVNRDIYACPTGGGNCWGRVSGSGLLAGAVVRATYQGTGVIGGDDVGTVAPDGTFGVALNLPCAFGLLYVFAESHLADGTPIRSDNAAPPC